MNKTKNLLWKIGTATVCVDRESPPIFIDGKQVPQRKYAGGYFYAIATSMKSAREKVKDIIRIRYDEEFRDISFYNTKPVEIDDRTEYALLEEPLKGLNKAA